MKKNILCRTLNGAGLFIVVAVVVTAATALAIGYRIRLANEWQQNVSLPSARPPSKNDVILVFAPHSDDETLGCGGMIATGTRRGAQVRVALLTNGDGFRIAVARTYKTLKATPQKCIEFAYKRQQETLAALETLGVTPNCVTFLGYPDRGIAALWDRNWGSDSLYVSHATGSDHSPYSNSLTRGAPYCGESLMSDIIKVLNSVKPTDVYIPHPCDNHSDHYATYCFVTAAIEQLDSERCEFARRIRTHTYLVHRGDWPCPRGDHPNEPLTPPFALSHADTNWSSLALPEDVAQLKRQAIKCYKTQTAVERGFLMSFARENELFGTAPVRQIRRVGNVTMRVDGDTSDWNGIAPAVVNPVGDYVVADMNRGGDVRSIYLCADDVYLYARVDCVRNLSKRVCYTLNFRGIDERASALYTVSVKPGARYMPEGVVWAYKGKTLEVAIPLDKITFDEDLFVQVYTKMLKLTLDNTGWHGFEFGSNDPSRT